MENECHNILEITGPRIHQCLNTIQSVDIIIDFHQIVPVPQILEGIECGFRMVEESTSEELAAFLETKGCKYQLYNDGERKSLSYADYPDTLAELRLLAKIRTGYANSYEWCQANWGTAGNAFDDYYKERRDGLTAIYFATESSAPLQIIFALSTQWPDLTFTLGYDEFTVGMSGELRLQAGTGRWLQYDTEWVAVGCGEERRRGRLVVDKTISSSVEPEIANNCKHGFAAANKGRAA